jgi:hypothetical protein
MEIHRPSDVMPTVSGSNLTFMVGDGASHRRPPLSRSRPLTKLGRLVSFPAMMSATRAGNNDFDSLTNLQEFALGTDPNVSSGASIVYVNGGAVTTPGTPVVIEESGNYFAVYGRRVSGFDDDNLGVKRQPVPDFK